MVTLEYTDVGWHTIISFCAKFSQFYSIISGLLSTCSLDLHQSDGGNKQDA